MSELPEPFQRFTAEFPEVSEAYERLGRLSHESGPLEPRMRQLVKLALAIGAGREGAVHSHVRRALEIGIGADEIRHTVLLSITTLGFPAAVAAYTWVNDVLDKA